jgi:hypothetical protein
MLTSDQFLAEIESFLAASGMSASAFGRAAVGDPNFVGDLRTKDRMPSLRLVEKVDAYIKANRQSEQAGAAS